MADLHPTESALLFQEGRPASELPEQAEPEPTLPEQVLVRHSRSAPALPSVLSKEFFHLLQPKRLRANMRRLRHVVHHLQRVENLVGACIAEQATRKKVENQQSASLRPVIPPLPPEGGEYRLFYISPASLLCEQKILQAYNANRPIDVLYLSVSILDSYCGLIRNTDMEGKDAGSILSSMAEVLQVALRSVLDTGEILNRLEPVRLSL